MGLPKEHKGAQSIAKESSNLRKNLSALASNILEFKLAFFNNCVAIWYWSIRFKSGTDRFWGKQNQKDLGFCFASHLRRSGEDKGCSLVVSKCQW